MSSLLIEHSSAASAYVLPYVFIAISYFVQFSVAAPAEGDQAAVPAAPKEPVDLTAAIATVASAAKAYSEANLPPTLPTAYKRWVPETAPDAPHDPDSYFPMKLVK